jgi:hypothetical protein
MTFDPTKTPKDLPTSSLLDLLDRTCMAHKNLNEVWIEAVGSECGSEVAGQLAARLWPQERGWKRLFVDDLRFVIAAKNLKPDLLTFACGSEARLPSVLTELGPVFRAVIAPSRLLKRKSGSRRTSPAWTGSPSKTLYYLRGKGIDSGFAALAWLWRKTERGRSERIDVDEYRRSLEGLSAESLERLFNFYSVAYMFVTNRWYQAVEAQFDAEMAQKLEMRVWVDLGAAEYDLDVGIQGIREKSKSVESLLTGFQFAPGEVGILNVDFELKNENHGILTHKTCPAIDRFEYYNDARLKHCCDICIYAMPVSGEMLDEKIRCKPLKLPPRDDADDIACQWEYVRDK